MAVVHQIHEKLHRDATRKCCPTDGTFTQPCVVASFIIKHQLSIMIGERDSAKDLSVELCCSVFRLFFSASNEPCRSR
uniref:Uncharacterized protein n=1 Tax=Physcomitrium patens TaxID=3218 RepID=A0A7I3Z970_PHYPA